MTRVRARQFEYSDGRQFVAVHDVLEFVEALQSTYKDQLPHWTDSHIEEVITGFQVVVGSPLWYRLKLQEFFGPSVMGTTRELMRALPDLPVTGFPLTIRRAREGLNRLFREYPIETVKMVKNDPDSPWIIVDLVDHHFDNTLEFAIWKETGNVYRCTAGEVEDDPFIEVTPLSQNHQGPVYEPGWGEAEVNAAKVFLEQNPHSDDETYAPADD